MAAVKLVFFGDTAVFPAIMNSTFETARTAFEISLGLTGVLSLWLGIMKIGERGGLVQALSRWLYPVLGKLFPGIPKGHPAMGNIFMNIAANMLGLDNAATPLGLKAMEKLQELNPKKDTATDAMIMFLVLNTSGLAVVPVGVMVYRAQSGAAQPTDVFIPILIATSVATLAGIAITCVCQRINLFSRTLVLAFGGMCALLAAVIYGFSRLDRAAMDTVGTSAANIMLFTIIVLFIAAGVRKRINVYEAFVEGAKGGFGTAVRIIPYLVAMLVGIGVFRAAGVMDWLTQGVAWAAASLGLPADWVGALPTALMKPLSGSGSRGMMVDCMTAFGPDSFAGRLSCLFQGSTDTTFYILAVYFGSVGVRRTRHAVGCGLAADIAGALAAVAVCYIFFG